MSRQHAGPHRLWVIGLTLLLHLAMLLLVLQPRRVQDRGANEQRLVVRLIALPVPPKAQPPSPQAAPAPRAKAPARGVQAPPAAPRIPAEDSPPTVAAASPAEPPASATPAQAAASAPWLDPEKTRQVLRMHAREVPVTEQAAMASEAPRRVTSSERLGTQIQSAATGDCLKSEFLGGNMGILSAPFWLLAEARGKCRR